ncbi:MAG: DUF5606 domain-containing protein [Flavobacteriales bacterium]|jgi:hypothetical protein|nr:DUF5606 domain-containing protein [Flavobacteriales bacterium]
MDLSGILSIAGYPGLFKLVGQMKNGMLVESLLDGKRMPAYATQRILSLEEISIYTHEDDVPLADIFDSMAKKTGSKRALNPKKASVDKLRAYLKEILPNYDEDRVYTSDLKKLFLWYNVLAEKGLLKSEKEAQKEENSDKKEKKPSAKKKAAKKPKKSEKKED